MDDTGHGSVCGSPIVATIVRDPQEYGKFLLWAHLPDIWKPMRTDTPHRAQRGRQFLLGRNVIEIGVVDERLLKEEAECVICYSRNRESVLIECGHNVCCMRCAVGLQVCPICRADVVDVRRAYRPH